MMNGLKLQDRINRGMGNAARKLGSPFIVYRPSGAMKPTASANRIIKLYASFNAQDDTYQRVSTYGHPDWWGIYDALYTQPGDYLVGDVDTFFVSAQRALLPTQCVRTNRLIDIVRPAAPLTGGYAGPLEAMAVPVIGGWPASLAAQAPKSEVELTETQFGIWSILLPKLPASPNLNDIVTDDLGQSYVVTSAEQSDLGWRLSVRQMSA